MSDINISLGNTSFTHGVNATDKSQGTDKRTITLGENNSTIINKKLTLLGKDLSFYLSTNNKVVHAVAKGATTVGEKVKEISSEIKDDSKIILKHIKALRNVPPPLPPRSPKEPANLQSQIEAAKKNLKHVEQTTTSRTYSNPLEDEIKAKQESIIKNDDTVNKLKELDDEQSNKLKEFYNDEKVRIEKKNQDESFENLKQHLFDKAKDENTAVGKMFKKSIEQENKKKDNDVNDFDQDWGDEESAGVNEEAVEVDEEASSAEPEAPAASVGQIQP